MDILDRLEYEANKINTVKLDGTEEVMRDAIAAIKSLRADVTSLEACNRTLVNQRDTMRADNVRLLERCDKMRGDKSRDELIDKLKEAEKVIEDQKMTITEVRDNYEKKAAALQLGLHADTKVLEQRVLQLNRDVAERDVKIEEQQTSLHRLHEERRRLDNLIQLRTGELQRSEQRYNDLLWMLVSKDLCKSQTTEWKEEQAKRAIENMRSNDRIMRTALAKFQAAATGCADEGGVFAYGAENWAHNVIEGIKKKVVDRSNDKTHEWKLEVLDELNRLTRKVNDL